MHNFKKLQLRIVVLIVFLLSCLGSQAQVAKTFSPRLPGGNMKVRGDMTMIANSIVNRYQAQRVDSVWVKPRRKPGYWEVTTTPEVSANTPYNLTGSQSSYNDNVDMRYVDVDNDLNTFSSSKATLTIPDIDCSKVVYAGLYWSATYKSDAESIQNIKFKVPNGNYEDINGSIIYNGFNTTDFGSNSPYACYADVTSYVTALGTPNGEYTVANIKASQGSVSGGISGGWTLFIIYENPTMKGKYIASFDGFVGVHQTLGSVFIDYSGFVTVPNPPVLGNLIAAGLEGDNRIDGDKLLFKAGSGVETTLGNTKNPTSPTPNFFNSTITILDTDFIDREPNSLNTLGYDSDMIAINAGIIPPSSTNARVTLTSTGDTYFMFFNALSVDIIEPEIKLLKIVEDIAGNNIAGEDVGLGKEIYYTIKFANVGNDDAKEFTITDILPVNTSLVSVNFDDVPLITGYDYDPATRKIVFTIPDIYVKKESILPPYAEEDFVNKIKILVKVASSCSELTDACSNKIENTAFTRYRGITNNNLIENDPSITGLGDCGDPVKGPANFLVDVDNCIFKRTETLCSGNLVLEATGDGYISYEWLKKTGTTDIPMGSTRQLTVTTPGEYYVICTPVAPCIGLTETVIVELHDENQQNPLFPYADIIEECPNDGSKLPTINLCGLNAHKLIETNIANAQSIVWEKLDETTGSCPEVGVAGCANTSEDPGCIWNQVADGQTFDANEGGQYRVIITYQGGCFTPFYFNVYKNDLDPAFEVKDIICSTNGEIKITRPSAASNYEFRLIDTAADPSTPLPPFGDISVFPITTSGIYKVELRQKGVGADGCVFTTPDIGVMKKDLRVTAKPYHKTCDKNGSVILTSIDVGPQYVYSISGPGPTSRVTQLEDEREYTFENLSPGTYTYTVTSSTGCSVTDTFTIEDYSKPSLIAVVAQHISCTPGTILLTGSGGQAPYIYAIFSKDGIERTLTAASFDSANPVEIAAGDEGEYVFIMKDINGCTEVSNAVIIENKPSVDFTTSFENISCKDAEDGTITYTVIATNGYGVSFDLVDSTDTVIETNSLGIFTDLAPGTYTVNLIQTQMLPGGIPGIACPFSETFTLTEPAALTGTISMTQPYTCTTKATIEVDVLSVTGGTTPYEYSIDGTNFTSTPSFTDLTNGTYTVTIKDKNGCTFETNAITVNPLIPITNIAVDATPVVCPARTSDISLTVTGGVGPFDYEMTGTATGNNATGLFPDLHPGSYNFEVTDVNGCTFSVSYTVKDITPITVSGQPVSNVKCKGDANGSLKYKVDKFSVNYSYSVAVTAGGTAVTPVTGSNAGVIDLTGLAAGTYTITVTDDVTNCTATADVTIAEPTIALTFTKLEKQPTCINTGNVAITASGGWGNYKYEIEQPDGTILGPGGSSTFTGLTQAGTYTITVKDGNGCAVTDTFDLQLATPPVVGISASSDLCYDLTNKAEIIVTTTGGLAPFKYSINGATAQTTDTFSNLLPETYNIVVTDANGCTAPVPTVTISSQLIATAVLQKELDCSGTNSAIIRLRASGGLAPYTVEQSTDGGTNFVSLGTMPANPWDIAAAEGSYIFSIKDAKDCIVETVAVVVPELLEPVITLLAPTDVLCFGDSNGSIRVDMDASVGTLPYVITVENTTTGIPYSRTTNLPAGDYEVTVTDKKGCIVTGTTRIDEPNAPISFLTKEENIRCIADPLNAGTNISAGEILVHTVAGGTPPYTYELTNNFGYEAIPVTTSATSNPFIILNYGIYEATVRDANGCVMIKQNITMASPPNELEISIDTSAPPSCADGGIAVVTVDAIVTGTDYKFGLLETNEAPYTTNLVGPDDPAFPRVATFKNLVPGVIYTFVVYDESTKCYHLEPMLIPDVTPSNLAVTITKVNNVTCTDENDGNVIFDFSGYDGGATAINYQVYYAQSNLPVTVPATSSGSTSLPGSTTDIVLGGLAPGVYYIMFEEVDGLNNTCKAASETFTITQSQKELTIAAVASEVDNGCEVAGKIVITGAEGTKPYQYQVVATSTPPNDADWVSVTEFIRDSGDYVAYIKDKNNCIRFVDVEVLLDPLPEITAVPGPLCGINDGEFSIDVTRVNNDSKGPFKYSINGGAFQAKSDAFSYDNLIAGSYEIAIQDVYGCVYTSPTITFYSPVNVVPTADTLPTCADNDGKITVEGTGGSGDYEYTLEDTLGNPIAGPQTTLDFDLLPAGDYKVIIEDNISGCTDEALVTLKAPTPVTFDITTDVAKQDISCNGANDGSITITLPASNDNPPYEYTIDNGTPITQTTPVFTGLAAGDYTITVTSEKDCSLTAATPVTINEPAPLTVTATPTEFACDTDGNSVKKAIITITASGGTPDYTYSIGGGFFDSNIFEVADTGSPQNITVTVIDKNLCQEDYSFVIDPLKTLTSVTVDQDTEINCKDGEEVTVTVAGGSGDFTFDVISVETYASITPGIGTYTATFTLNEVGNYTFKVTDNESDCTMLSDSYTILPYNIIEVTATGATPVTCYGDADGSITINVANYPGINYDYKVSNGVTSVANGSATTTPFTIPNLPAGNYYVSVTATDVPFCSANTQTITVQSPADPLVLTVNQTSVTCDNDKGEIIAQATGGRGTYLFEFINDDTSTTLQMYASNNALAGLPAGNYTINVQDVGGCIVSESIELIRPARITASITASTNVVVCHGDTTATMEATTVSGGQGAGSYQYILNRYDAADVLISSSGAQTSPLFTGLGAGTYSITVIDGWNCSVETSKETVTEPDVLKGFLSLEEGFTCTEDGELTIWATGGTPPYEYSTTENGTYIALGATPLTITIPRGSTASYRYYIKDACDVLMTNDVEIQAVPALAPNLNLTNARINCAGESTGEISAVATGGLGNYQYILINEDGVTPDIGPQPSGTFSGLPVGEYSVKVISEDCDVLSGVIKIEEPELLEVIADIEPILCFDKTKARAKIITTGGTAPIQYAISPRLDRFDTNNVFSDLGVGTYKVIVQDANGCFETLDIIITQPDIVAAEINTALTHDELCYGKADASVTIDISGGIGDYETALEIDGIIGSYEAVVGTQHTFDNLAAGTITIHIKDGNGCAVEPAIEHTINPGVDLQASITPVQVCDVMTITVDVNPAVSADITYYLDGVAQGSNVIVATGLTPGTHTIDVTHTNGCNAPFTFTVAPVLPITMGATSKTDVSCFGGTNGTATVTATGGTTGFTYAISAEVTPRVYGSYQATGVFTGLAAGSYVINAKDALGCESESAIIVISEPAVALMADVDPTHEICLNAENGTITVIPSGGTAPYFIRLDSGTDVSTSTDHTFTGLAAGTYTIDVRDTNNCTIVQESVTIDAGVDIQAVATVTPECTGNTPSSKVTIDVDASVNGDVEYSVDGTTYGTSNEFTYTSTEGGTYTAYVRHTNGCVDTVNFDIDNLDPVTILTAAETADVECFEGTTGEITVTANGGTGALEYAISPDFDYQPSNVFTGLTVGTYTVKIKDGIGCETETVNILIDGPTAELIAAAVPTPETCINANDGIITVTPSGGTAPYFISLNDAAEIEVTTAVAYSYTSLADGSYTIDVRDANNCIVAQQNVTIEPGVAILPTVATTRVCETITVTIGVDPAVEDDVEYSLDDISYQTTNVFVADLAADTYTVYVKHVNGCKETVSFTVDPVIPIIIETPEITNVLCFEKSTGEVKVTATGGTGALEYALLPLYNYGSINVFDVPVGTYTLKVRDAIGCEVVYPEIIITQPAEALVATANVTPESCILAKDGKITINVTGGTAPYSTALNTQTEANFQEGVFEYTGLYGGNYDIFVRDANGCYLPKITVTVVKGVNMHPYITTVLSCNNNLPVNTVTVHVDPSIEDEVTFSLTGVAGSYTPNPTFEFNPGMHTVYIEHVNGCKKEITFNVADRIPVTAQATAIDALCNAEANGSITVTASGGTGELKYGIAPGFIMSSDPVFNNLLAGNHTIRVEDSLGCFTLVNLAVDEPTALQTGLVDTLQEICVNDDNGAIEIEISGGTAPYFTSLDANGNFVEDQYLFENLNGGITYTIYVKDANGCITTLDVPLDAPLDVDAVANVVYNCEENTVTIVTGNGIDATDLTYSISNNKGGGTGTPQTSNVFEDLSNGNYIVEVIHVSGCTDTVTFSIENSQPLSLTLTESGLNQITATTIGGSGSYRYEFNGDDMGSNKTFVIYRTGTYKVIVTDSRGCTAEASIHIVFVEISIPDIVTPDNDGHNDGWGPGDTENYPLISTDVFDRYGRKLATLSQGQTWDCKYEGNEMPTGDYWYLIKLNAPEDSREFIGHFTIYR
ncbi:bacterial transduction protein [compost metagenome]